MRKQLFKAKRPTFQTVQQAEPCQADLEDGRGRDLKGEPGVRKAGRRPLPPAAGVLLGTAPNAVPLLTRSPLQQASTIFSLTLAIHPRTSAEYQSLSVADGASV